MDHSSRPFAPPGYPRLIPRILATDPDAVAAFVRTSFGATGDPTPGRPTELRLGGSMLMNSYTGGRAVRDPWGNTWQIATRVGA